MRYNTTKIREKTALWGEIGGKKGILGRQREKLEKKEKIQGVTEATLVTIVEYDKIYSGYTNSLGYSLYLFYVFIE